MSFIGKAFNSYLSTPLPARIAAGIVIGALCGLVSRNVGNLLEPGDAALLIRILDPLGLLGDCFISALKAVAPLLVLLLVMDAVLYSGRKFDPRLGRIVLLYLLSTVLAALAAVTVSFLMPVDLILPETVDAPASGPGEQLTLGGILSSLIVGLFMNPLDALLQGKFLSILMWAGMAGMALKICARDTTREMIHDLSLGATKCVGWIISLAPLGIMGLVYSAAAANGPGIFQTYGMLILSLLLAMALTGLVINPLLVFLTARINPYPLVFRALRESGVTAFFTRSSAANIPVNMRLCRKMGFEESVFSVSIPLGATVNMCGATVTITVMTLATVHTLGIEVTFLQAAALCCVSALGACGASGVAGGSLLLIPLACSVFGIPYDVAMATVGVGFVIGVIQDSMETALNSSSDVVFTGAAEYAHWKKHGKGAAGEADAGIPEEAD